MIASFFCMIFDYFFPKRDDKKALAPQENQGFFYLMVAVQRLELRTLRI